MALPFFTIPGFLDHSFFFYHFTQRLLLNDLGSSPSAVNL